MADHPETTSSTATRVLGIASLASIAVLVIATRVRHAPADGLARLGAGAVQAVAQSDQRRRRGETHELDLPVLQCLGGALGAGLHATIGILLALQERHRSGQGQVIDVALYEAVFNCMESLLPEYSAFGAVREPAGSALPGIAPTNAYRCSDGGYALIAGNGDSIFKRLMTAIGRDDLGQDPALADNTGRVARVAEIDAAIGEWTEAAAVVFLFALSELLEGFSVGRARRAIQSLLELTPETALVKRGDQIQEVRVEEVKVDETLIIKSGARVPLDGVVTSGESAINQAPITGESMPVEKNAGDTVFAGTINGEGSLDVRVTKPASDSTLARIIHLVSEAQSQKAPSQRFVDTFARYYTPAVFFVALLVWLDRKSTRLNSSHQI